MYARIKTIWTPSASYWAKRVWEHQLVLKVHGAIRNKDWAQYLEDPNKCYFGFSIYVPSAFGGGITHTPFCLVNDCAHLGGGSWHLDLPEDHDIEETIIGKIPKGIPL